MNIDTDNLRYRIALSRVKGMNLQTAKSLLDAAGGIDAFFTLRENELKERMGVNGRIFSETLRGEALLFADREIEFIRKAQIQPLFFTDPEYPARLSDCPDAPLMLYYRGSTDLNPPHIVSIVGTRHATPYGKGFCEELVRDLAELLPGTCIVSGLAYGIDICAHRAALKNGLPTLAILAHGLNQIYPASHRNTAIEVVRQGGLLTEYGSQQTLHRALFLARNRIVAGISDATIVIESGEKGGSLVTAAIANSYHRDVFALPGRKSDPYSIGCNRLIQRNHAVLIDSAESLAEAMGWHIRKKEPVQQQLFPDLSPEENEILNYLRQHGEAAINRMTVDLNRPTSHLLSHLIELEFKGLAISCPGGMYRPI